MIRSIRIRNSRNSCWDILRTLRFLYFQLQDIFSLLLFGDNNESSKGKGHPCTDTEALYRPYGP